MIETLALHKLWLNDHSSQKICQHLSKMVFITIQIERNML